jgi:hypothetical protein
MAELFEGIGIGIVGSFGGIVAIGYVAMKTRQIKRARRRAKAAQ